VALVKRIVLILVLCAACSRDAAPTPEFARAKKAYDDAMGATADTSYAGARWDEVVRLLHAVPEKNAREHRTAALLADDIESTRAKTAAQIASSRAEADKLLDVKSLPPLPTAMPATTTTTPPAKIAPPPPVTPAAAPLSIPGNKCGRQCQDDAESCLSSSGCTQNGTSWSCPDGNKMNGCYNTLGECAKRCAADPPHGW
jgi:hypothetical protein